MAINEIIELEKQILPYIGSVVWWVHDGKIAECEIRRIQANKKGLYLVLNYHRDNEWKQVGAFHKTEVGKSIFFTFEEVTKALEQKPCEKKTKRSADIALVRHGHWIEMYKTWEHGEKVESSEPDFYLCSNCSHDESEKKNYCGWCGAKMDEGGEK